MSEMMKAPYKIGCECVTCTAKDIEAWKGENPWGPPSEKDPGIEELLETMSGRTTSIKQGTCVPAPIGCGKEITRFKDQLSQKEYTISGLCQECQDSVFGGEG